MIFDERKRYYVYIWYIVDTLEVFYVGKGTGNRYKTRKRENKFFTRMVNSHNCASKIIINDLNEEEAFKLEIETIAYYRKQNCRLTNILDGGENPPKLDGIPKSNEWKAKARKSRLEYIKSHPNYSRECSERMKKFLRTNNGKVFIKKSILGHQTLEYRKKVSERSKIHNNTVEYKTNQSKMLKEKWKTKDFFDKHYGKNNHRAQCVLQYNKNNELLNKYDTVTLASKSTGVSVSKISAVAKGKRKTAGGYIWKYLNDKHLKNKVKNNLSRTYTYAEKPICQYNLDGRLINTYKSITQATSVNNYKNRTNIIACLKNKTKTAYGYVWKYSK